jgi:hypothetical protein
MMAAFLHYRVPVIVHHKSEDLPGILTVARRADGRFWDGRLFVRPDLYMTMEQPATPKNGGFFHMTDEDFLEQVRTAFGFVGGAYFDFIADDFGPLTATIVDFDNARRRTLH